MKKVSDKWLRDTQIDAELKVGTQHAVDKEKLCMALRELEKYRELIILEEGE